MNLKYTAIYTILLVVCTAAITRYYFPQVDTQVRIEEKEVIKRDVKTVIKEIVKPDGTKEKETIIIDNTTETRKKEMESLKTRKKDWFVAGGASINPNDIRPVYNVQVNRRVLGPFYLGASVNTRKDIGVYVGFEF